MFADEMDKYEDYAMGYNASNPMPLWAKPRTKVSPNQVFDATRDHYEGTKVDMRNVIGAGGEGSPDRLTPLTYAVDGQS